MYVVVNLCMGVYVIVLPVLSTIRATDTANTGAQGEKRAVIENQGYIYVATSHKYVHS